MKLFFGEVNVGSQVDQIVPRLPQLDAKIAVATQLVKRIAGKYATKIQPETS